MEDNLRTRTWYAPSYGEPEMIYDSNLTYDNYCQGKGSTHHANFEEVLEDKDAKTVSCIGIKDRNNKLIYEGDIVKEKWFSEDSEQYEECLYVVEFSQEHCAYCLTEVSNGYKNFFVDLEYIPEDYEIIGNIYENPDLLVA